MKDKFSIEEKRKFMLKKHIKDHLFEYILDIILTMLYTIVLLYLCKAQDYILGIILSFLYSIGKLSNDIHSYKKDYINVDVK